MRPDDPIPADSEADGADPVEPLMARCLATADAERAGVFAAACAEHPELAPTLKRRLALIGALLPPDRPDVEKMPERLGGFRLLRPLGHGGMGVVYLAVQDLLHREVALKLIRPEHLFFPGARDRFRREVEIAAKLKHPGIVPIHLVGEESGIPFYAMERVDGASLSEVLVKLEGRSPEKLKGEDLWRAVVGTEAAAVAHAPPALFRGSWTATCVRLVRDVALALAHAHANGVLHRDVKPSNLMVTRDGRVMLLDFGLASSTGTSRLTRSGSQPGSLPYMSPEQLRGDPALVDERTDVYSLGVALFELLTLRLPFRGEHAEETRRLIAAGQPPPLRLLNRAVPWDVETVCLAAMESEPARRYSEAAEFARDLDRTLELQPIHARRPGAWFRTRRLAQRHPGWAASILFLVLLLVGVPSGLAMVRGRHMREMQDRYDEIRRLSDAKLVRDAIESERKLHPCVAEQVRPMGEWVNGADELLHRRGDHMASRARVAARVAARAESAGLASPAEVDADRWQLEVLDALLADLTRLESVAAAVRTRRDLAERLPLSTLTSDEAAAAWEEAIDDIASSDRYGGLELEPQLGLLPLEPDPQSGLWEFWHVESGARPVREGVNDPLLVVPENGLVFVLVPGGTFDMGTWPTSPEHPFGTPNSDPTSLMNELPVHSVTLAPFFLSKYEMTREQWERVVARMPDLSGSIPPATEDPSLTCMPMARVNWFDCDQVLTRMGLSLPTDAQWEYACRAGTTTVYSFGDRPDQMPRYGNVNSADNRAATGLAILEPTERWKDGYWSEAPIGRFLPNPFGFFDMHGNMLEWCRDWSVRFREAEPRPGDGWRGDVGEKLYRILRGGSSAHMASVARSASRMHSEPLSASPSIGLRPARAITAVAGRSPSR